MIHVIKIRGIDQHHYSKVKLPVYMKKITGYEAYINLNGDGIYTKPDLLPQGMWDDIRYFRTDIGKVSLNLNNQQSPFLTDYTVSSFRFSTARNDAATNLEGYPRDVFVNGGIPRNYPHINNLKSVNENTPPNSFLHVKYMQLPDDELRGGLYIGNEFDMDATYQEKQTAIVKPILATGYDLVIILKYQK